MTYRTTRRKFVQSTAALGVGFWVAGGVSARASVSALEEIRFGCVGVGGKGSSDSADANDRERNQSKVVAVCDIDDKTLDGVKDKFPGAKHYNDYRKMLEEMDKSIDAVTVSTPDHTHAVIALMAMDMGKHCFCQKPLTHSIEEARKMAEVARAKNLATQMGNQGTALSNLRLSAALIKAGIIGTVKEVHCWSDRPVWPQSYRLKAVEPPMPEHVHWNEWIGPAKMRPYSPDYHDFKWRGFWDFGTGALGDMACHTLNMAYMALDLRDPLSVTAKATPHDGNCYPESSVIEFEFGERKGRPPVKLFWYDGRQRPDGLLSDCPKEKKGDGNEYIYGSGALLVGDKGKFFSPGDYGGDVAKTGIVVDGEFTNQRKIKMQVDYPRSPDHFTEFANAIRGNGTTVSNFPDYAGPLTETILLGNLAIWATGPFSDPIEKLPKWSKPKEIIWNAEKMETPTNDSGIQKLVRHDYHNGYTIHSF
jgi:predicted dehydrogenase